MVAEPVGSAGVLVSSYQSTRDFAVLPRRNPSGARAALCPVPCALCQRLAEEDRGAMRGGLLPVAERCGEVVGFIDLWL